MPSYDRELLEAALIGYEQQKIGILTKIEELRALLGNTGTSLIEHASKPPRKKRAKLSKESRMRMAEAQRKRWANARKANS